MAYEEDGQVLTPDLRRTDSSSSPMKGDDRALMGGVVWVLNPQSTGGGCCLGTEPSEHWWGVLSGY